MATFVVPKFPATIVAGNGMAITKTGRTYTFNSTFTEPPEIIDLPAATLPLAGSTPIAVFQSGEARQIGQQAFVAAMPIVDKGTVGTGTVTFTISAGLKQKLTVSGALAIAFTGWPSSGNYGEVEIQLVNGTAGVTWPALIKWLVGDGTTSTTFSDMGVTLGSGSNWVIVWSTDGGSTIYGKAG